MLAEVTLSGNQEISSVGTPFQVAAYDKILIEDFNKRSDIEENTYVSKMGYYCADAKRGVIDYNYYYLPIIQ